MSGPLQELARAARRWPTILEDCRQPEASQAAVWARTLPMLEKAPFWKARYGGRPPTSLRDYDVTTFDDYEAAIEASWGDGLSRLSGEQVVCWALSSGTSGRQKRFPWTQPFMDQHRQGSDLTLPVFEGLARRKGRGPLLSLVATSPARQAPSGATAAYASNLLAPASNPVYPRAIDASKEWFLRWMPLYALAADLGGIRAVSCDHVFLLIERIERDRAWYDKALRGEVAPPQGLPMPKVTAERLAWVRGVLGRREALDLTELWPQLKVIHTWRAATAGLQADQLARTASRPIQLVDFTYAASEGPIANPVDPDAIGGPILPGSAIHEFMEVGANASADAVFGPSALEVGRRYEVLLTTLMGMVRYRIRDIVECTGFFHATPILRFVGREGAEISLGVTTFSEHELLASLASLGPLPRSRRVFGPSEDGRALVLYNVQPLSDAQVDALHAFVAGVNDTYRGFESEGRMAKIRQQTLSDAHPMWKACEPPHAQAKPVLLLTEPPSRWSASGTVD